MFINITFLYVLSFDCRTTDDHSKQYILDFFKDIIYVLRGNILL